VQFCIYSLVLGCIAPHAYLLTKFDQNSDVECTGATQFVTFSLSDNSDPLELLPINSDVQSTNTNFFACFKGCIARYHSYQCAYVVSS